MQSLIYLVLKIRFCIKGPDKKDMKKRLFKMHSTHDVSWNIGCKASEFTAWKTAFALPAAADGLLFILK